ncbi:MAG: Galanin, partial [Sulfurimonas sp.]|nr:Galanin [Sulfurimonas sp.]
MKTTSELTDFYYKTLYPVLNKLEKDRKQLKHRILVIGSGYTLLFLLIIISMKDIILNDMNMLIFIGFAYVGLGAIIYKMLIKDYTAEFKDKVIEPLINELDSNLRYSSTNYVSSNLFRNSKLFTSKIDR